MDNKEIIEEKGFIEKAKEFVKKYKKELTGGAIGFIIGAIYGIFRGIFITIRAIVNMSNNKPKDHE